MLDVKEAHFDKSTDTGGTRTYYCPKMGPVTIPIMPWAGLWKFVHQPDLIGHDYHFNEFDAASGKAFGGERTLVGRKEVSRNRSCTAHSPPTRYSSSGRSWRAK